MSIDEIITELLLRWEENPSLTPEELCREYEGRPEHPVLLERLPQERRNVLACDAFIDTTIEQERSPQATPPQGRSGDRSSTPDPDMPPGYTSLGKLGEGGMGEVYLAQQHSLKRRVALKKILVEGHPSREQLARFYNEAQAVAQLKHSNIVQIHEIGEHKGLPYFSLEFVEGGTLKKKLGGKPLPPVEAARLAETLACAMHYAHEHNIVHRDLKPANILLTPDGLPKISDFGLAKQLEVEAGQTRVGEVEGPPQLEGEAFQTGIGAVIGTPSYMAPEQASGNFKEAGPPADIYALGAIFYEFLTGRPPFQAATLMQILEQVKSQEPVSPRRLQPKVPRDLETICLKCLQKEPAKRYHSAQALADDLRRYLNGETIVARRTPIWERSVKWARRRPTPASLMGAAALLLLLISAVSLWYWDRYWHVKVEYFANATRRWNALEGHSPITEEEARHRTFTYKFSRRGRTGPVETVEIINGLGELSPQYGMSTFIDGFIGALDVSTKRECRYEFKRDQQGQVIEEIAFDRNGEIVWIAQHSANKNLVHYTDKEGRPAVRAPSGATYVRLNPDEEGHEKEVRFLSNNARDPRPNRDGVFGISSEYSEHGLPIKVTFLGADGRPTLNKSHVAGFKVDYNDRAMPAQIRYFGLKNESVLHKDGYARLLIGYDNYGNFNEFISVGLDDRPTLNKNGFAKSIQDIDPYGNVIRIRLFDAHDKPTLHKNGHAETVRQYDERGRVIEESYIGLNGHLILVKTGVAKVASEYDDRGNIIRMRNFDTDGKLTMTKDGYAEATRDHDDRGNIIRLRLFDADGKPTLHKDGYAEIARKYNDGDRLIEETYFGTEGKPTPTKNGPAKMTIKYDDRGNKSEVAYFDDKGEPTLHKDGNWKVTMKYDDNGDKIETTYIGLDRKPTFVKGGFAKIAWNYDEFGNKIEEAYLDPDGQPTLHKERIAKIRMRYDDRGNQIEQAIFDVRDNRILSKQGFWKKTWSYDESGHKTEEAYFGLDDRPILVDGVAKVRLKYDNQGNKLKLANFGLNDEPVRFNGSYSKLVWKHDTRGNRTEESYLDPDGKRMPVNRIAKHKWEFDARSNKVGYALFDLNDKPARHPNEHWSKKVWKYDSRGNQTEESYLDPGSKPMAVNDIAKMKYEYDSRGNKIEVAYFGLKDEPVRFNGVYWKKVWKYDTRGNQAEEAYFDPDGKPMLVKCVAKMKSRHDNLGNIIELAHYGLQEEPVLNEFDCAKITWRYDPRGNQIEQATFDKNGQPTLARYGNVKMMAKMTFKYDDRGNQIEAAWYGVDGKLMLLGDAAKWKATYDPRGNLIEQTWFDADDRPKRNYSGFATVRSTYDGVRGNKLEEAYYGPDDKPTLKEKDIHSDSRTFWKAGYAKVKWAYNDMNERSEATYFDVQGNRLKTQVCITAVSPYSPAKIIGLQPNDILVNYGGQEIRTKYAIENIKRSGGPGDKPKDLTVLRDGKPRTFRSTPLGLRGIEMVDQAVPGKNEPANSSAKKP